MALGFAGTPDGETIAGVMPVVAGHERRAVRWFSDHGLQMSEVEVCRRHTGTRCKSFLKSWYSEAEDVRRALASSLLSLLLITTMMSGGCISCEQYFMFQGSKGCCDPDGHCKRKAPAKESSAGRECTQIAFDHQKSIHLQVDLTAVAVVRIDIPVRTIQTLQRCHDATPVDTSPPDLQILHSTFLI